MLLLTVGATERPRLSSPPLIYVPGNDATLESSRLESNREVSWAWLPLGLRMTRGH